jgi:hypothetical protein
MRREKAIIFIWLFILLSAQTLRAEVTWRVTRTKHFIIYYAVGRESTAERAGSIAEKWHAVLSGKLKLESSAITPIYLYPDRRSFSEATGVLPGENIVGLAHTRTYKVRIDASGAFVDIEHVIPHELVHVFISRKLKGRSSELPLWMHEGIAKYLAGDWSAADAEILADIATGGGLLPLGRISKVFPEDDEKRSIAYVESYSAVKYMADLYSPESITDLLDEIESGQPFETALFYSIGSTPEKFEADWRQCLWEKYKLGRWFRLGSTLVWVLGAVFVILAFRARLIAKRRKAREFEEEDTSSA